MTDIDREHWHEPSIRAFTFQQITETFDNDEHMYNRLREAAARVDGDARAKGEMVADVIRAQVQMKVITNVIRTLVLAVLDLGDGLLVEQLGAHYGSD